MQMLPKKWVLKFARSWKSSEKQSALKKSLDCKQHELDRMKPLTVAVPKMLSECELQDMAHEIKEEPNEFEPLLKL